VKKSNNKKPRDFPLERPGESLYEKESRWAEAILAKQRAVRKTAPKSKKKAPH
jgi:hypothetical protein